ncbi:MAG: hypothetical protein JO055_12290 [Alphaproteobacteria bacterium]|nr:hypothetical protein [Alphaproteobacteria bacterium]
MPIRWTIVDAALVDVAITGVPTFNEFRAYIDEVALAGGKRHARLLDMTRATLDLRSGDVKAMATAVIAQAARADAALGPVAIVVDVTASLDFRLLFEDKACQTHRDLAVFANREMALAWLTQAQRGM